MLASETFKQNNKTEVIYIPKNLTFLTSSHAHCYACLYSSHLNIINGFTGPLLFFYQSGEFTLRKGNQNTRSPNLSALTSIDIFLLHYSSQRKKWFLCFEPDKLYLSETSRLFYKRSLSGIIYIYSLCILVYFIYSENFKQ